MASSRPRSAPSSPLDPLSVSSEGSAFHRATLGEVPFAVGGAALSRPIACAPDGSLVAGSSGRLAWIVRASDGVVLHRLDGRSQVVTAVCFSRDGATLFTVGDRAVIAWSVADGTARFVVERAFEVPAAALSPDGARLVVDASKEVVALDAATGEVIASAPRPFPRAFVPPVFTADGRYLVIASSTHRELGEDLRVTVEVDPDRTLDLACPVGESSLLAAVSHRSLFLYDLDDHAAIAREPVRAETHALFAQGDALWAVHTNEPGSAGWHLRSYDAATLRAVAGGPVTMLPARCSIACSGDALWVLHDGSLRRHPLAEGGDLRDAFRVRGECVALRFDAKAEHLSACIGTYAARSAAMRWRLSSGEGVVRDFVKRTVQSLTPDGAAVLVRDAETQHARRYAFDGPVEGEAFDAEAAALTAYAPGPDGRCVAIDDDALRVLPDGPRWPLPKKHKLGLTPRWHAEHDLVTAHDTTHLLAFDLREGVYLEPRKVPRFLAICDVPGGAWIVTETAAQLWDARARAKLRTVKIELPQGSSATSIAASRDGRLLAVGTSTGALLLVELEGAVRRAFFQAAGEGALAACAFSDDGALLATGCADPSVRVWDVALALDARAAPRRR